MESAHERQLRIALRIYLNAVGRLPCPGAFASFHGAFAELRTHNFRIPHKPWLNPYELAGIASYIALQLPFQIHPLRVARTNALVYKLFSETEVSDFVQGSTGLSGPDFLKTSMMMLDAFVRR
jgi:hypothetical protein